MSRGKAKDIGTINRFDHSWIKKNSFLNTQHGWIFLPRRPNVSKSYEMKKLQPRTRASSFHMGHTGHTHVRCTRSRAMLELERLSRGTSTTHLSTSSRINQSIVFQSLSSIQGPVDIFLRPTERWGNEGEMEARARRGIGKGHRIDDSFILPPYVLPFSPASTTIFLRRGDAHPIDTKTIPIPIGKQAVLQIAVSLDGRTS